MSNWISVKDRLPKRSESVMVFTQGEFYKYRVASRGRACLIRTNTKWYEGFDSYYEMTVKVTHWQPLPEPPKERKE